MGRPLFKLTQFRDERKGEGAKKGAGGRDGIKRVSEGNPNHSRVHTEATCRQFHVQPALNLSGLFLKDASVIGAMDVFEICVGLQRAAL